METFNPLLNNKALKDLCDKAQINNDTPLRQARDVIRQIAIVRKNTKLRRYTKEERRQINEAKRLAGVKPWKNPYEDTQSYNTRPEA